MFRRFACALLALMLGICAAASAEALLKDWELAGRIEGADLYLVCRDGLWGVADAAGEVVLEPQFRSAPQFVGEYAVVAKTDFSQLNDVSGESEYDSTYGVMNRQGEIVIPVEYDAVELSDDGEIAKVKRDNRYGFIACGGGMRVEPEYDDAGAFIEGHAAVMQMVEDGFPCGPGDWGIIDASGKEVVPCGFDALELCPGGLAWVQVDGKWGLIDLSGDYVVEPAYDGWDSFLDGYTVVYGEETRPSADENLCGDGFEYIHIHGVVDAAGAVVLPLKYEEVTLCGDGLAEVCLDGRWGLMDLAGEVIARPTYGNMRSFVGDYAAVCGEDGRWGAIDRAGKVVIPLEYDGIRIYEDETARAGSGDVYTWYDLSDGRAVEIGAD